jgi:hypothetical protein
MLSTEHRFYPLEGTEHANALAAKGEFLSDKQQGSGASGKPLAAHNWVEPGQTEGCLKQC